MKKLLLLLLISGFAMQLKSYAYILRCKSSTPLPSIGNTQIGTAENPYKHLGIGNLEECEIYQIGSPSDEEETGLQTSRQVALGRKEAPANW